MAFHTQLYTVDKYANVITQQTPIEMIRFIDFHLNCIFFIIYEISNKHMGK
jgi:hypothetical protein